MFGEILEFVERERERVSDIWKTGILLVSKFYCTVKRIRVTDHRQEAWQMAQRQALPCGGSLGAAGGGKLNKVICCSKVFDVCTTNIDKCLGFLPVR